VSHSDPLPAVRRALSREQWIFVCGLLFVYELASVRPTLLANRAAGVPLSIAHALIISAVDGVLWFVLIPPIFIALDRMPLRHLGWLRNAGGRLLLALLAMAVQAAAFCAIVLAAGWVSDLGVLAARSPLLSFGYEYETNAPAILLLYLAYALVRRVDQARREQRVAQRLAVSLSEARLHALSVELQPHFLFNTMNAIAGLLRDEPAAAETMLVQLSDLLRLTLQSGSAPETSLSTELERLELYLGIQQMRFGSRLTVRRQIDSTTLNATVPALLLQPIVENALTHGLGAHRGPSELAIESHRSGDRLVLTVQDNGVGIPAGGPLRERIGLGNTKARLANMFADDYKLELSSPREGGTVVTVIVPFRPLEGVTSVGDSRSERSRISADVSHLATSESRLRRLPDEELAS
jgi:two-component system LytT family sensor kinase